MPNMRSFAQKLRQYADSIPEQLNAIKQEYAIEAATELVPSTPVDTGRARGNWQAGLSRRPVGEVVGVYGGRGGLNLGARGDASIEQIRRVVRQSKPRQRIYITNNVPYIQRLNEGYSTQAPARFVQMALQRARETIEKQRIRYGRTASQYKRQVKVQL